MFSQFRHSSGVRVRFSSETIICRIERECRKGDGTRERERERKRERTRGRDEKKRAGSKRENEASCLTDQC